MIMEFHKVKKVVIVTEAFIMDDVLKVVNDLGVGGYTVSTVTGKGTKGIRHGSGILDTLFKNVKIDIVVDEETAKEVMVSVRDKFFKTYAGIVYMEDVEVLRPDRFRASRSTA
ncbi:P-II family nitrogen regulator [Thermodesulfovibrionales bacterium]|nr:P-II family nitrogen regulator [Thermodesulfovibrionales bacterium]